MSRRKATPEELELWNKVAKTTERLRMDKSWLENQAEPQAKEFPASSAKPSTAFSKPAKPAPTKNAASIALPRKATAQAVSMDQKTHQRLKQGKLKPEARIDLHGMTVAEAHPRLIGFVQSAHARGLRLVLVITGKGKGYYDDDPVPVRRGVLRHSVPQWLATAPLSQIVLQVTQAHQRHGGGGAFYVYLKRLRK